MELAFFVVNFGFTKQDYEALTPTEQAFIYKAWETKVVTETTYMANAVYNAVSNAMRKKGKKFTPLWRKKQRKHNKEAAVNDFHLIEQMEKENGKSWVDKIYAAYGSKVRKTT